MATLAQVHARNYYPYGLCFSQGVMQTGVGDRPGRWVLSCPGKSTPRLTEEAAADGVPHRDQDADFFFSREAGSLNLTCNLIFKRWQLIQSFSKHCRNKAAL